MHLQPSHCFADVEFLVHHATPTRYQNISHWWHICQSWGVALQSHKCFLCMCVCVFSSSSCSVRYSSSGVSFMWLLISQVLPIKTPCVLIAGLAVETHRDKVSLQFRAWTVFLELDSIVCVGVFFFTLVLWCLLKQSFWKCTQHLSHVSLRPEAWLALRRETNSSFRSFQIVWPRWKG